MTPSHFLARNRFGLGAQPGEAARGDAREWLLAQFGAWQPSTTAWQAIPRTEAVVASYAELQRALRDSGTETDRKAAQQARGALTREAYVAAVAVRTRSALDTPAPFVERLVHFWANHFALSAEKPQVTALAGSYEAEAIRPHVLGRFEDMLLAVERHPAMLLYLDQAVSIGPDSVAARRAAQRDAQRRRGLNENLAREILELHTLGVRSGYTQEDVTELARALTGWSVQGLPAASTGTAQALASAPADAQRSGFVFRPQLHEPGARTVLARNYPPGDEGQGVAILQQVARSRATAQHIARKLARHFIADEPPAGSVERIAEAFLRSDGDLPTVYRALVAEPAAWAPQPAKFKTPWEWAVSSLRALGVREVEGAMVAAALRQLGQPLWRPGSPAGFDDVAASWAAPDALVRRVEVAQRLATRMGDTLDARALAPQVLADVSEATANAIARADTRPTALALLLVSPEFLRR